jgi:hypothetical protein
MKCKRIYIDTEFSGFGTFDLISLGCVSDCGQTFYAETDTIRFDRCNDFVRTIVLPLLSNDQAVKCDPHQMCNRLRVFLAQFGHPLEICFDFKGDWQLFRRILETDGQPLPHNIRKRCVKGGSAQQQTMQDLFEIHRLPAHHALNDAKILMMCCEGVDSIKLLNARQN